MYHQQLADYIRKSRIEGYTDDTIKNNLIEVGWNLKDINDTLGISSSNNVPMPGASIPPSPSYTNMWDAFEHVLMFISLYFMATSFALILHQFINKWAPGTDSYRYSSSISSFSDWILRASLASLIVTFPLFAFFHLDINKRTLKNNAIRNLKSRRTLIYTTLVGTFLIMLGKIIQTVFNFLNGNVSFNFILHFFVTVSVSAMIFAYYLYQVRADRKFYG